MTTKLISREESALVDYSGVESDDQLLDLFLRTISSTSTRKAYSIDLSSFLVYLQKLDLGLKGLTLEDAITYTESVVAQYQKETTVRRKVSSMKSFLTFAHRTGYLRFNVGAALKVRKPRDSRAERYLSQEQIEDLLDASNPFTYIVISFLYGSAVRLSELRDLKWKDVHFAGKEKDFGAITLTDPKGGGTRTIPVLVEHLEELKMLRSWCLPVDQRREAYVFGRQGAKQISKTYIGRLLNGAAQKVGITHRISAHWFRHSHATHAIEGGAPIQLVQRQLGHASITTTNVYLDINPKDGTGSYLWKAK